MKPRAFSAHHDNHSSTNPKRRYERLQTENSSLKKHKSFSSTKHMEELAKKTKQQSQILPKPAEQIFQQNLNLKSFINNLQKQLVLQRSRLQMSKKNNLKYTKQLSRQFQKEIYYVGKTPNAYVVAGIKHQYQTLKNLYQVKCTEVDELQKRVENTQIQELRVHIDALQQHNAFLKNTLQSFLSIKQSCQLTPSKPHSSLNRPKSYKQNERLYSQASEYTSEMTAKHAENLANLLAEQKENRKLCLSKIQYQNRKIQQMGQRQEQLLKKIEFLQNLLIQKDNNEHLARRQYRKIEKERAAWKQEIASLKQVLVNTEQNYKQRLRSLQEQQKKKFEVEQQIFKESLEEKEREIANLEKEVRFLSTMLSYWKPLDQINKAFKRESESEYSQIQDKKQRKLSQKDEKQSNSFKFRTSTEKPKEPDIDPEQKLSDISVHINKEEQTNKRVIADIRSSQNASSNSKDHPERPRRDCSKKHSEKAKKLRKVDLTQIKHLGELIRFKLLGHSINIQTVKSLLNEPHNLHSLQGGGSQSESYITMKEMKHILTEYPFMLSQHEATSVSRYIVQDSSNPYVYCDEDNQIDRSIAKSILKAFIGDYTLPRKEEITEEWSKIKKSYLSNILTALRQLAPKGNISFYKFNELIIGLGIEMSEALKDWIVGELVIQSPSLEELSYEAIQSI